jgi:hypothetical protein
MQRLLILLQVALAHVEEREEEHQILLLCRGGEERVKSQDQWTHADRLHAKG